MRLLITPRASKAVRALMRLITELSRERRKRSRRKDGSCARFAQAQDVLAIDLLKLVTTANQEHLGIRIVPIGEPRPELPTVVLRWPD